MSYTKGYRYNIEPSGGGENQIPTREIQNPTYASTLSLATTQEKTVVEVALTGDCTINADITDAYACDELLVVLTADGSSRTVTFGTNFITNSTVAVGASKSATIGFVFSSGMNKWVEKGRFVQS